ncbi:MAG TPA: hypothetical protein VJQ82_25895 [Terriglobales bacterium]|nr:hypothetical protein [Terriglobales bacterium]
MNLEAVMGAINLSLRVLSRHTLCFVALFMTFGVFCWALWLGTWIALAAAGAFGSVIFLPILSRSIRPEKDHEHSTQ